MRDLQELRMRIDEVDSQLIRLFEERMDISREIAEYKQKKGLLIVDENREKIVVEKNISNAKDEYKEETREFIETIMTLSKDVQKEWLANNK